jgi:GDP/UDP-N,N'-diacetylbacillosamine 2-epimerase (hydrolysing)
MKESTKNFKLYVASFSRSSNGAIETLLKELNKNGMITNSLEEARYVLAVGDRIETYNFVLQQYVNGKHIIHLWAGEASQGTYDEVFRHSMTLMSDIQLCTNKAASKVVKKICDTVGKKPNAVVVGNIMADNLDVDESILDDKLCKDSFDLILYNPCLETMSEDMKEINDEIILDEKPYIWILPNMDRGAEKITQANTPTLPRPKFLALLKNCHKFITNSSSAYYEAPFFLTEDQIIKVGLRNKNRNSKSGMEKKNATKKIIKAILKLGSPKVGREPAESIPLDSEAQGQPEPGQEN